MLQSRGAKSRTQLSDRTEQNRTVVSHGGSFLFVNLSGFGGDTWSVGSDSWPGIEPQPLAVKVRSLNQWTSREVPSFLL